ncbi:MAG: 50S ribosomal protein L21 [Candidatus Riesia sp.]|nr:50S ribosomal protein L21 [Candidatus Riesia sp.]
MYAIILDRNKQYIVKENNNLRVDFLDVQIGTIIEINQVLLYSTTDSITVGTPFVENKKIKFEVIKHIKDEKKVVLKFKRRKHYMKKSGHRQKYTLLKII